MNVDDVHEDVGFVLFVTDELASAMNEDIQFRDLAGKGFDRGRVPDVENLEVEPVVNRRRLQVADRDMRSDAAEGFGERSAYTASASADEHMLP
jgi:hypothetical protein